ncbi:hypothetical protein PR202_gb24580 [Eleusine coracana subsp. coracana]|uniref:non-specific serine/threonine protein kinase n=1 Tax=Eleusine coracana subsp. coracana TaxID=191504 RepID=A0AAV5FMX1_ELECO|nr:hypothetical protein PR202_gb24580 [Eleusine coracana subsp. coracana]
MVLTDYDGTVVWRVDGDFRVRFAQLLDTGNLVMKDTGGKILWQSFDSPTDTLLPSQPFTANTKLVAATQLHISSHHILSFSDMSILSLIYDDPDVSDIYWPDPDTPFFNNDRKRYNNTRLGVLNDHGQFVSSDFATQKALTASDAGPGIKRRLTLDPDGNLRIYSLNSSDATWKLARILADEVDREEQSWIAEFADYRLDGQLNCLQARTLIKLAVSCLEEDKNKRPTMETILQTLLSSAEADGANKTNY